MMDGDGTTGGKEVRARAIRQLCHGILNPECFPQLQTYQHLHLSNAELRFTNLQISIYAFTTIVMTASVMRKFTPSALTRVQLLHPKRAAPELFASAIKPAQPTQTRSLANVRDVRGQDFAELWFNVAGPSLRPSEGPGSGMDYKPPDERTLKLGKSKYLDS
jgi:hypothetical protein